MREKSHFNHPQTFFVKFRKEELQIAQNDKEEEDDLSAGAIVGICVAVVLVIFLILALLFLAFWAWREKKRRKKHREEEQSGIIPALNNVERSYINNSAADQHRTATVASIPVLRRHNQVENRNRNSFLNADHMLISLAGHEDVLPLLRRRRRRGRI